MKKCHLILVLFTFSLFLSSCKKDDDNSEILSQDITLTDADGNIYQTVAIGNQVWMAENLKTTTTNDGNPITEYRHFNPNKSPFAWVEPSNPQELFQWASTFDLNNIYPEDLPIDFYGAHYNHEAIQSGKLNIEGWRLPTRQDFEELIAFLGNEGHAGNEATVLKSATGWVTGSGNGTDLYGFTVRPAGNTIIPGTPDFSEASASLCTSDINMVSNNRIIVSFLENGEISIEESDVRNGFSIRYIKE